MARSRTRKSRRKAKLSTEEGETAGNCGGGGAGSGSLWQECREALHDFVANSSIRGLKRTLFSPSRLLRVFWTVFVLGSFVLAMSQVAFLLEKYLKRETTVQQQKIYGHLEAFPAVSFCVSDPFSDGATELWSNGAVESPNAFSRKVRHAALKLMQEPSPENRELSSALLRLDQREAYFQNVGNLTNLMQLGHTQPFYFCAINPFDYGQPVFKYYDRNSCNLTVTRWLHPIYLNCYTLSFANRAFSQALKSIFLVLPAGRSEPRDGFGPYENASFLRDTLKKYTTMQVVLHETKKKPNFDETVMLTAHPSDINVISFTTSKYVNNDCSMSSDEATAGAAEVANNPNDFDACLEHRIEQDVIDRCACTQRLMRTDPSVLLCFAINWTNLQATASRMACSLSGGTYLTSFAAASRACPRPCQSIVYDLNVLRSANRASAWQDCWYMWMLMDSTVTAHQRESYLMQHLNASGDRFDESVCRRPWYHQLLYVKLKIVRQDFTTRTFNETLVLTSAALFAQVGAALAFYLGLTLTFLAELADLAIRLGWRCWISKRKLRRQRPQRQNHHGRTEAKTESTINSAPCDGGGHRGVCIANSSRQAADENPLDRNHSFGDAWQGQGLRCDYIYADEEDSDDEGEADAVVPDELQLEPVDYRYI